MSLNRYAKKIDKNQKSIVDALRTIPSLTVHILSGTIDLCIGWQGRNYLIELKSLGGKLTDSQIKFLAEWQGQVNVCHSLEDILEVIGING